MPLIRTYADVEKLPGGPTPAEDKLIAACVAGEPCILGTEVPADGTPDPDRRIRADVLRYLITGGCEARKVADTGVDLTGGHVTGKLDLNLATAKGKTQTIFCRFNELIEAEQTKFGLISLTDSNLVGLNAEGAQIKGGVFLGNTTANATINLSGAEIGGHHRDHPARLRL